MSMLQTKVKLPFKKYAVRVTTVLIVAGVAWAAYKFRSQIVAMFRSATAPKNTTAEK